MAPDRAGATENQEQVVVSPAQQAVNEALFTATTEVQQANTATNNAIVEITQAQTEYSEAQPITAGIATKISLANTEINNVQTAINTISNVDLSGYGSLTSNLTFFKSNGLGLTPGKSIFI